MKTFTTIWFGQLISLLGSGLTGFAVSVWVYQRTSSVTQFALVLLATMVPRIAFSPLAGVVADRWERRRLMIASDLGTGLSTLLIYLLVSIDHLAVWHIYLAMALGSSCNTFQGPAFSASITLLVSKEQLGRANGMQQTSQALSQLLAPLLGGFLVTHIGLRGVLAIDIATFLFAVATLLIIRIPRPERTIHRHDQESALWHDIVHAWRYLTTRSGLLALMSFFAVINFAGAIAIVLLPPFVLSFTSADMLGMVLSVGGGGLLVGGFLMSLWGGPQRRTHGIFGFVLLFCPFALLVGLVSSVELIAFAIFGAYFTLPFINGCTEALLQSKVAPDMQGRVFALRQLIGSAMMPLGYLVAGPLADGIFELLMAPDGLLANSLGGLIGVGRGRGMGLIFVLIGLITALVTLLFYLMTPIRLLDAEGRT